MISKNYKIAVILSFVILVFVHLILIYNTFTLKDRDYNISERGLLEAEYGKSIPDDKVYSGGGIIIDSILRHYMPALKAAWYTNPADFNELSGKVSLALCERLRSGSTMDSVFHSIVQRNKLDTNIRYLLTVQRIELNFHRDSGNIWLYDSRQQQGNIPAAYSTPFGFIVDGQLEHPQQENMVTSVAVSGMLDYSYRITFDLFADRPNRLFRVALQMLPTFILALICIAVMVSINYYTARNWMKQKKDAEMKTDFIHSIKHEFNTPISTILVAGKSLRDADVQKDKDRISALADILERQARRLQSHVNQLLDVSMIKEKLELEATELNYFIMVLVNDYSLKLSENEKLTFDPAPVELFADIDRFAFTTMLTNLLDNAFRHNSKAQKRTSVAIAVKGSEIVISVQDNGNGIDNEMKQHIFEKFRRGTNKQGLGLGLYYVKECTAAHGWKITVTSATEQGSEFAIHIPKPELKSFS
ncbi:two-component system, OmpR family, phosphate regulon sensor histidine kinase PhoR [Chitinophaga terrae (ex Kim and Jung 2007)]|uniref:histidine kinase n=1 Tax=Chitinophaga terrae (ex Kim and Jung 2007) TaxID=408074 RepID=A0A1H4BRF8_9BACT|nr:HAMP domain-containing sensor histidine kinase [Chitinophaga terrae (ex Kim and Jung 2007)]GEP89730.1 hypothetical protein CTE07_13750 [Chitinophaga terrae (ex Kim and Jung 2007)]SEA50694.1 two-component system, OmpR family, phosphate regulon sensor histidine kinase PhoR [Chitinophaga terrae (ex Kim and Jung 2007)]